MANLDALATSLFSEHYTYIAIFSGMFALSYMLVKKVHARRNLPPCFWSVPLLGSIPFMPVGCNLGTFFTKKAKELGPIFSMMLGNRYAVVLNGRSAINEAFLRNSVCFASRPVFYLQKFSNPRLKGIVEHPYNEDLKKYLQLSLSSLRKIGFGRSIMECRIHAEIEALVEHVRRLNGSDFDPNHLVTGSVLNVISSVMFGERYEHSSPTLERLIGDVEQSVSFGETFAVVSFFPVLRFIPKHAKTLESADELLGEVLRFMDEKVEAALMNRLPESFTTHYIDSAGPDFDREQLLFTLRDVFVAGTDTTSSTLLWAVSFLANHRDIQRRLVEEIDSVVPPDRLPSVDDRKKLPRVESTILEVMRLKAVVPLGLFHETLQDVELSGFFIPKGTVVFANLTSAHLDDETWVDPEAFNPDRFLDASGKVVGRERIIPFSLGKRSCLGELLAQQEIFLVLTGILQNFRILPPEGQEKIACHEARFLVLAPSEYKVRLVPRSK